MVHVTGFFAGILAFMFIGLSFMVVKQRRFVKTSLGHGGDDELHRRIRAQGNFAEYVPFAIILLAFGEGKGVPAWIIVLLGMGLIAGRVAHAYSLLVAEAENPENSQLRTVGMIMTFAVLGLGALLAIFG